MVAKQGCCSDFQPHFVEAGDLVLKLSWLKTFEKQTKQIFRNRTHIDTPVLLQNSVESTSLSIINRPNYQRMKNTKRTMTAVLRKYPRWIYDIHLKLWYLEKQNRKLISIYPSHQEHKANQPLKTKTSSIFLEMN